MSTEHLIYSIRFRHVSMSDKWVLEHLDSLDEVNLLSAQFT